MSSPMPPMILIHYAPSLPIASAQPRKSRPTPVAPKNHPSTGVSTKNAIKSNASS